MSGPSIGCILNRLAGADAAEWRRLLGRAKAAGLDHVAVGDVLTDDQFILQVLARIGPTTTSLVHGGYRVHVGIEADDLATRSAGLAASRRADGKPS